jgi:hypothetical protein
VHGLFKIFQNDSALIQCTRRISVETKSGNETFGRHLEQIGWFLVWINLIWGASSISCVHLTTEHNSYNTENNMSVAILAACSKEAHPIIDVIELECRPNPLNKWTEATPKQCDRSVFDVGVDDLQGLARRGSVIFAALIRFGCHTDL